MYTLIFHLPICSALKYYHNTLCRVRFTVTSFIPVLLAQYLKENLLYLNVNILIMLT